MAGARGTGWISGFGENGASFLCFEDSIHVQGFDPQGNLTGEEDVGAGFGIEVDMDGDLSDVFELTFRDYQDWQGFKEDLGEALGETGREEEGFEEGLEEMEGLGEEDLEDIRQEGQEDRSQAYQEEKREEEEGRDTTALEAGEEGRDE